MGDEQISLHGSSAYTADLGAPFTSEKKKKKK
jgi:hypothetical protein